MIDTHPFHMVGEKYVSAVRDAPEALPLLIPVLDGTAQSPGVAAWLRHAGVAADVLEGNRAFRSLKWNYNSFLALWRVCQYPFHLCHTMHQTKPTRLSAQLRQVNPPVEYSLTIIGNSG